MNQSTSSDLNGNSENVKKVLESFKKNIDNLTNNPVSQEELDRAKITLKSGILNQFEHSRERNNNLKDGLSTPYGINYTNELLTAVDKTTSADIEAAAKYCLEKPSLISVEANQETLNKNKEYLSSLGELVN